MTTQTIGQTVDLSFLFGAETPKQAIAMPEGGNLTTGFAGPWATTYIYRVWHNTIYNNQDMIANGWPIPTYRKDHPTGAFYYYANKEEGDAAAKAFGLQFGCNIVWHWEVKSSLILGATEELLKKLNPTVQYEVDVVTLGAKKNRHALHMLMIPSAVQSLALCVGALAEPVFDYESLRDTKTFDLNYQHSMIGTESQYADSILWKARAEIWTKLGEPEAWRYTVNQGGKHDVNSPLLQQLLLPFYVQAPELWACLTNVPDPRLDALGKKDEKGEQKRLSLPIVTHIWKSRADAAKELELTDNAGASSAIPDMWKTVPDQWVKTAKKLLAPHIGKPREVILGNLQAMAMELQTRYGATPDQVIAQLEN